MWCDELLPVPGLTSLKRSTRIVSRMSPFLPYAVFGQDVSLNFKGEEGGSGRGRSGGEGDRDGDGETD